MQGRQAKARGETRDRGTGSRHSHPTGFPFPQSPLVDTEGVQIARRRGQGVGGGGEKKIKVTVYLLKQNINKPGTQYLCITPVANKHISNQTASGIL